MLQFASSSFSSSSPSSSSSSLIGPLQPDTGDGSLLAHLKHRQKPLSTEIKYRFTETPEAGKRPNASIIVAQRRDVRVKENSARGILWHADKPLETQRNQGFNSACAVKSAAPAAEPFKVMPCTTYVHSRVRSSVWMLRIGSHACQAEGLCYPILCIHSSGSTYSLRRAPVARQG